MKRKKLLQEGVRATVATKADAPPAITSFDPNQRVLLPFDSFVDKAGRAYFNMVSSLHTSRLSAYGFTAEAYALDMEYYQINEQLDNRICPVCAAMHGRKFRVDDARKLLDVVLRVTDPEDLKALQPWPSQSKDSVAEISKMTTAQLVAQGWHIPPYHPRCRGLLARVGRSPTLQQIQDATTPQEGPYTATQDDFAALGYEVTKDQVDAWNAASNVSPAEVAAAMQGQPLDEYLGMLFTSKEPTVDSGVEDISFHGDKAKVEMTTSNIGFGSKGAVTTSVAVDAQKSALEIQSLKLADSSDDEAYTLKKLLQSLYPVTQDLDFTYLAAKSTPATGMSLARGGFVPDLESWLAMKKDIASASWYEGLSVAKKSALDQVLASDAPGSVYDLVAMGALGKQALGEVPWLAYLDVTNPDAMAKFLTYFGG